MSFDINTNIASLQAQQYLRTNSSFQAKTINEVTSGLRIVSSGDDAAGLAIANGYRSDQAVIGQGVRNANDGLSQLQIADGGISNISQLLDRARTLATQSATGTFTGSRAVLNSEFQSVIGEINRQAQAIGLDQGGAFAKNLSVFIGGGKANATTAIVNGSVSVDLSKSTVDAKSLGLQGVQAIGATGTDIGNGSVATSVSAIVGNAANVASEAAAGSTNFTFQGPGFGNNNPIQVAVNLTGVTDANTLVAAVNAAIQNAGNGATQGATAFKNAGISASLNTDASGKTQLTFNSSTATFQVAAGDQVSQALLGNFQQNAVALGTNQAATIATNGGGTAARLTLSVDGATPFNVDLSGVAVSATASKADIVRSLNNTAAFSAVATASLEGNQLEITSKGNSATSAVTFTTTTLSTNLGLASATAAAASTGADLSTQVQADGNTAAGTATFGAAGAGTITFQFQGSGLTAPVNVSLTTTAATTVAQAITALSAQVSSNASLKAAGISLTTATAGNALTFTGTSGGAFSVGVTGDVQNLLGAGSFVAGSGNSFDYSSLTGANYNSPAGAAAGSATLQFSINGGASAGNAVTVDLTAGTGAAVASVAATANAGTVALDSTNNVLNLNINGTGVAVTLTQGATQTLNSIATQINTAITAAGGVATVVNNQITISTALKGAGQSIQIAAGSANTVLGFAATGLYKGASSDGNSVASQLNAAFGASSTLQKAGLTAAFSGGKITISSNNGTFFRTDALGTSAAATVAGTAGSGSAATAGVRVGTATAFNTSGGNNIVSFKVDGGATQNITITSGASVTATQIASDINATIAGGVASVDGGGHVQITSSTTGILSTVQSLANVAATHGVGSGVGAATYDTTAGANIVRVKVDGGSYQQVTLASGAATTAASVLASFAALNGGAGLVGATASLNVNQLVITSNSTGATSSIQFDVVGNSTANTILGLTSGAPAGLAVGSNAVASANAILGFTTGTGTGAAASGGYVFATGVNDTLNLTVDGTAATVTFAAATTDAATTVTQINTQLNTALGTVALNYASVQNNRVQLASQTTGSGSSIVIAVGNANTTLGLTAGTTTGTSADLGYGVTGHTFAIGNTATAAPVVPVQVDAGGSNASSTLAFTPVAYGTDTQTVSLSALDSTGGTHSLSTLLQNNGTSRSGESLDSSINAINTALQQSNDTTLQSIVAVKEDTAGTEGIRFLSASGSFKVSIGTTAGGGGIGSQGTTGSSAISGGGSTADISTQAGALSVVNTLANSVAALGSAQAVVGRGENQFNYAINLAQSQLTNLASAESQIRDADLAAQAANLTKAQILLQAGVAALAQANSAPQAVLALLKG
jgi:flagellin